jgi:hypothetical protein
LRHLQSRPALGKAFTEIAVCSIDEWVVVEVIEEGFSGRGESQFEIAEQRQGGDDSDGLLEVGAGDFAILVHHFLGGLDLLEVAHSEEHPFSTLPNCLKIEEVVVLHLVMRAIGHGVVHHQVFDVFDGFARGEAVFYLHSSFVMEIHDHHTEDCLFCLVVALIVLVDYFFQQQCPTLQLALARWKEGLKGGCGETIGRGWRIGFECHGQFLLQVVGDMVVGVALEVGLVLVV